MALGPKEEALVAVVAQNVTIGTSSTVVAQIAPPPSPSGTSPIPGLEQCAIEVVAVGIVPRANMGSGNNLTLVVSEVLPNGSSGSSETVVFQSVNSGIPVVSILSSPLKCDIGSGLKVTGSHASAGVAQDVTIWFRFSSVDKPEQRLVVGTQNV